jgi:aerobic-type carbon monoxide dehydrogenase small subunit (CoxS/CutS family)
LFLAYECEIGGKSGSGKIAELIVRRSTDNLQVSSLSPKILVESKSTKTTSPIRGIDMMETISFRLNGKPATLNVDGDRSLLWVLRTDLGLTGTKFGCGESLCGACTVVVNKEAVRSCQLPVREVRNQEVVTIEGLGSNGKLHPLQEAFIDLGALQCGFCTSGMIMNAYGLLLKNPNPTRDQIVEGMEDNLCRCGTQVRIIQAIENASKSMRQ